MVAEGGPGRPAPRRIGARNADSSGAGKPARGGRRFLWISLSVFTAAALVAAALLLAREMRPVPAESLKRAGSALATARAGRADVLVPDTFTEASRCLDAGRADVDRVSRSWWPFHTYSVADSLLRESIRLSEASLVQAGDKERGRQERIAADVATFSDSLRYWRSVLDRSLSRKEEEVIFRKAELPMRVAQDLVAQGRHEAAVSYLDTVRGALARLTSLHSLRPSAGGEHNGRAKEWVAATIKKSAATGKTAIIVDKSAHKLYVLSAGKVTESFPCDLGYNSGYQKRMAGDGATPEGTYRVKHVNRGSKYYRALLLDYPNADDQERFRRNLQSGAIPAGSHIGGLIEIHGHGGTGRDWTDGCVAVTNAQMDRLLKKAPVGTPVTIVSSWER